MAKPISSNFQNWSKDDFRLLVVLLLTVIYPLFVASFYALYVFTLLPAWVSSVTTIQEAHHEGWYHYYWLVVALFWIFLCALILPCFWDPHSTTQQQLITMSESGGPSYPTKTESVQPSFIHVEESVSKKRVSVLSIKSRRSSDLTLEKEVYQEASESKTQEKSRESLDKSRESLDKSRESLDKSCSSLERAKLTQSGEFLNDFIDCIQTEKQVTKEAECEVHVEEKEKLEKKDTDENVKQDTSDSQSSDSSTSQSSDSSDSSEEADEPDIVPERNEAKVLEATQEKIDESEALADKPETLEEMDKEPEMRKKARPTVDTSKSASELYECSMPTPLSAEAKRPESNMVFLFVNPESAATKEDVIIEHEGDVTPADPSKEEKDIIN